MSSYEKYFVNGRNLVNFTGYQKNYTKQQFLTYMTVLKNSVFLATLLFLSLFSCQQEKKDSKNENVAYEYYPDGSVKIETQVKDTLAHGLMKIYSPGGRLKQVFTYNMGKREGPAVEYYPDGQLRSKSFFKDNKMEGTTRLYYETGELYRETNYKNGVIDGIRKSFYKDGKVLAEAHYRKGYPGLGLKEYDTNGKEIQPEPKIIVTPLNQLALNNKYILLLRLSENQSSTTFYIGDLEDGFLHEGCWPIQPKDGEARYEIHLNKGSFMMEKLVISAMFTSRKKNIGVVSREYNLAIDNK